MQPIGSMREARNMIRVTAECEEFEERTKVLFQGGVGGGGKEITFDAAKASASVK